MKKFLYAVLFCAALYAGHHFLDRRQIERDSQGFVSGAISAIANGWEVTTFAQYADPKLLKAKNLAAVLANYRTLGKFHPPADCEMKDFTSYKYKEKAANYIAVNYQCNAEFDNASAVLFLDIYRFSDISAWKIESFELRSSFFNAKAKK